MQQIRTVSIGEVQAFLQNHPGGFLIDVLPPEFHAQQHIPGSSGVCVFETAFQEKMRALVPDMAAPLLVYGAGGSLDLNPRLQPWQGCTLPLSYSRSTKRRFTVEPRFCQALFLKKHIFLFHLFRMPLNMSRMLFLCRERSGGAFFRIRHQKRGSGRSSVAMPVLEAEDQASVGNH